MMMRKEGGWVLFKTLAFSMGMILIFTLIANQLPQVEGEAPVDKEVDLGALTMESFIALGDDLFHNKGTCTLCHNAMGRAPDLLAMNVIAAADEHLADSRYQGKAKNSEQYLHESMVDPGAFVVANFGKKGSNDTESPMPAVKKAPIELSDIEMNAIIAFLQSKDGNEVTVALPTDAPAVEEKPAGAAPVTATTAEEAFGKYGCQACHVIGGVGGPVGPSLDGLGGRMDIATIRQSIIEPDAVIAEGFFPGVMPGTFAEQMTVKELEMIIQFFAQNK